MTKPNVRRRRAAKRSLRSRRERQVRGHRNGKNFRTTRTKTKGRVLSAFGGGISTPRSQRTQRRKGESIEAERRAICFSRANVRAQWMSFAKAHHLRSFGEPSRCASG